MLLNTTHCSKEEESSRLDSPMTGGLRRRKLLPPTNTIKAGAGNDDEEDEEGGLLLARQRWLPKSSLTIAWGDEYHALEHGNEQLTDRFADKKEALYVRRRHSCWLHCNFPSECHHAVYKAQKEGKPVLTKARALDKAYLARVKEEKEQQQQQQQQQQRQQRAKANGPSGVRKAFEEKEGSVREYRMRSDEFMMRFSDESSDSDSSISDLGRDEGADNILLPDSPPTEDEVVEVIEGREPVCPDSPIVCGNGHTTLDLEGDYSYTAFRKAAGIDTLSVACISPTSSNSQTFKIHMDEDENEDENASDSISRSISPVSSTAAAAPSGHLSSFHPFKPFWTTTTNNNINSILTSCKRSTAPPSPIEPSRSSITTTFSTLDQLEQAYSAQAWFPSPSSSSVNEPSDQPTTIPLHHRCRTATASRAEDAARMLTLLGRRTSSPSSSPVENATITTTINISVFEAWDDEDDSDKSITTERPLWRG